MGLLALGMGAVPCALTGSWEPILHAGLPCPAALLEPMGGQPLSKLLRRRGRLGRGEREKKVGGEDGEEAVVTL